MVAECIRQKGGRLLAFYRFTGLVDEQESLVFGFHAAAWALLASSGRAAGRNLLGLGAFPFLPEIVPVDTDIDDFPRKDFVLSALFIQYG